MLDEVRQKELIDIFEDMYDKTTTAKTIVKEANTMLKDWSVRAELEPKNVKSIYNQYAAWRDGRLKWGDDEQTEYEQILLQVMDAVTGE